MRKSKILLVISIVVLLLWGSVAITFASRTDLQNRENELGQSMQQTQEELDKLTAQLSESMRQVHALTSQIVEYESRLTGLNYEVSDLESQIDEQERMLNEAEARFAHQEEMFRNRLVAMYMAGETSFLDVLLSAQGLVDFISSFFLVSEIAAHDTELLNQIERSKNEIIEARAILEQNREQIEVARNSVETTRNSLQTSQNTMQEHVNELTVTERELKQQLEEYERAQAQVRNQIAEIQRQEEAARQNNNQNNNNLVPPNVAEGQFAWPVPGFNTITSPFGMRWHPVLHQSRMHTGIDIAGPGISGANVVAANDGIVTFAGWMGGYGNTVMINHGGGIVTLYAHGSSILVSSGQSVTRGQSIMTVGTTGVSTGPHLHFEVIVNGSVVDPVPWVR
ncbi:MAG: peptidoglycan DD-metalloendopeptidase family protein [Oscillospiraceae bacterium]|nr:peptidoglycan DD-metalloendopeptidase family protein [Oscillospiraceae bacterium]